MLLRASKNTTMTVFFLFWGFRFLGFFLWHTCFVPVDLACLRFFLCVDYGSKIRLKKRQLPAWAAIFVPYLSISLGVFSSRGEPAS